MLDPNSTVKISSITKKDEKEYAREQYALALANMLEKKTLESVQAFEKANKKLFEVEDAYRLGLRLLTERAQRVSQAFMGLVHR